MAELEAEVTTQPVEEAEDLTGGLSPEEMLALESLGQVDEEIEEIIVEEVEEEFGEDDVWEGGGAHRRRPNDPVRRGHSGRPPAAPRRRAPSRWRRPPPWQRSQPRRREAAGRRRGSRDHRDPKEHRG